MKYKIELTEEQQTWLLRFLNREWDAEVEYQWQNNHDTSYLEDMLDVYDALLGKTNCVFIAMAHVEDIDEKRKQIQELKESEK